ncbi:MAG: exodeoxyribonuclease VII large subunit [Rhodobacteraceae bacterium]|nr:exodeoxyribonuclease VII large subunit [Paracoccaceae bacterium]
MDDLIEDDGPGGNAPEYTVSEISGAVKRSIEAGFSRVRVRGELGRVSRPRSGHVYLDLKDDRAVLSGVIWKGQAARMPTQPEEGMEVIATGRLTTFPGQSKYQIIIESLAPAGVGALMAMLDQRRRKLEAEGLFAEDRKRALPFLPEVVGVVTSPSGAVIRDILHRLRDRFPRRVLIWPVAVQGEKCAPEVTRAIRGFNALPPGGLIPRPDVLIVARGGGSLEDLWGFNEEAVVRAAAQSTIPLISAVGHETDTTLIDHAADRRAPTPTAAAEIAVPVRRDLLGWTAEQAARLTRAAAQQVTVRRQRLRDLSRALPRPLTLTAQATQRLDLAADRLPRALRGFTESRRLGLRGTAGRLNPAMLRARIGGRAEMLNDRTGRLGVAQRRVLQTEKQRLDGIGKRLAAASPSRRLALAKTGLRPLAERLRSAALGYLEDRRERMKAVDRLRNSLGYTETLRRGFAVVRAGAHVITTRKAAAGQPALEIEFADGRLPVSAGSAPRRRKSGQARQGSLFDD